MASSGDCANISKIRRKGRKHRKHSYIYAEDVFGFFNVVSGMCSRSQQKFIVGKPPRLYDKPLTPYSNYKEDICFFYLEENGLTLHQRYWADYGDLSAFPPPSKPAVFLPAYLKYGRQHLSRTYPRSYSNRSMTLFKDSHPEMECSVTSLQTEDLTVPAGTFKGCVKVCIFYKIAVPSIQMGFMRTGYIWLAKDKDIIKEETIEMWNFALPGKPNSINEVRFWKLASIKHETNSRRTAKEKTGFFNEKPF